VKAKVKMANQAQNQALEEILLVYEDKRLVKAAPHGPDRVELVKTILNRARDIERDAKKVDLTKQEPDMTFYDGVKESWKGCPFCKNKDITHIGGSGAPYQGCKVCSVFLNSDGTLRQMGR
jgi:predicted methyltransferase